MRIDLLGAQFNIKSDENPEYLEEVVEIFRSKIEEVRGTAGTSDPLKIAILAGILTADENLKQTGQHRINAAEAAQITIELIADLETALGEDSENTAPAPTVVPDPTSLNDQSE